jgi:hypothetical protein
MVGGKVVEPVVGEVNGQSVGDVRWWREVEGIGDGLAGGGVGGEGGDEAGELGSSGDVPGDGCAGGEAEGGLGTA